MLELERPQGSSSCTSHYFLYDILLGALSSFQVDRPSPHHAGLIVGMYKMLTYLGQQAITYFNGSIMVYITQNTPFVTLHEKKYEGL